MGAKPRAEELGDAHHDADLPGDGADHREDAERADIGGEVQQLGVRGRLEHAVAGKGDEGEHVERARAGAEHAIVEADGRNDGHAEQERRHARGAVDIVHIGLEGEVERDRDEQEGQEHPQ